MLSRRLEMVILSAPRPLESVTRILLNTNTALTEQLSRQFLPILRYHNPGLVVEVGRPGESEAEHMSVEFSDKSNKQISDVASVHAAAQAILDADRLKAGSSR